MKLLHLLLGVSVLATAACGGSGGGGTTQPPAGNTQTFSTIRLGNTSANITAGATTSLSPTALDTKGAAISGVTGFTYTSSAPTVAEIGAGGVILGVGAGTATITVSLTRDGVTASSTATVTVTGALPAVGTVAAGNADQTFAPATIVVAKNASVTFTFGALQHNVTFRSATGAPANVANSTNTSVARSFPTAGDFGYDCSLHAGMSGTIIVR